MGEKTGHGSSRREIPAPMKMDFKDFVQGMNALGDPRGIFVVDEDKLFVARRPETVVPGQEYSVTRQYYRPSDNFSAHDLKAEIELIFDGKSPARLKHVLLEAKNERDLFSIRVGDGIEILAGVAGSTLDIKYKPTGELESVVIAGPNGDYQKRKFTWQALGKMRMAGEETAAISIIARSDFQKVSVPLKIDPYFSELVLVSDLVSNPMTSNTRLDSPWINANWQELLRIDWKHGFNPVSIRDAVRI